MHLRLQHCVCVGNGDILVQSAFATRFLSSYSLLLAQPTCNHVHASRKQPPPPPHTPPTSRYEAHFPTTGIASNSPHTSSNSMPTGPEASDD